MTPLPAILESVCLSFGVTEQQIRTRSRPTTIADARSAFYCIAQDAGWSSVKSGRFIGRTHAAALSGKRRARNIASVEAGYRAKINGASRRITETA